MDGLQNTPEQLVEEIATLRARVAELEPRYAMASSADRERMEETLRVVAAAALPVVGQDFLRSLVRHLAGLLQVRIAFVSQVHETVPGRLCLLALWEGSHFGDNFEYDVRGTPCEHVFAQGRTLFPEKVWKLFPEDLWLRNNKIESYLAIPLLDSAANPMGHLGVVDGKPMRDDLPRESLMRIFAGRAGAELQRMRTEAEMQASQARYQDLYDNAPDMFVSVDVVTGNIIECNQTLAEATGYTKEEILGQHISKMYHPDSEQDRKRVFEAFVRDGEVRDAELELRRKDGGRIWVSLNLSSVRGEQGEVRYSRSIWRDITERKRVQQDLEQSEGRFRTMFRSAAIAMALDDEDGRLLETNPAFQRMFGYTAPELAGKSFVELTHPDDVDVGWKLFQELVAGERDSFQLEKRYLRRDGTVLSGMVAVSAIRDSAGRFRHSVAMVEDITARKKAQEAVRADAQRSRAELAELQHIYDAAPVGLCLMDTDLRYLRINHWLAAIHGISIENHIGRTLRQIVPEIAETMEPVYHKVLETGEPALDVLATGATPADPQDVRHFMASYYPLKSADGVVWALSSIVRDVTEYDKSQDRLRRQEAELVHVARLGTMGEMASGIAHELNQPLTAIVTHAEAGRRAVVNRGVSAVLEDLDQIAAQAQRAGDIIRRLRSFAAKRQPTVSTVDINTVVREASGFVSHDLRRHGIQFILDPAATLALVLVDRILIQQVLLNLMRNAIEAMSDTQPDNHILKIHTSMADADMVQVTVSDCGSGIATSELERIFEPFYTTKPEGLGFGLSLSRSIIESYGGRLEASRNPDRGMTFRFTLPANKGA